MKKILIPAILAAVFCVFAQSEFDELDDFGSSSGQPEIFDEQDAAEQKILTDVKADGLSAKLPGFMENIFDGRNVNVEEMLGGDDPEIKGYISNLQQSPFNENIISFEVATAQSPAVRLFLYNIESQFLVQVSSIEDYEDMIGMVPYPVKDKGVSWHPSKNWFVFYSNGNDNREQIFIAEIRDPYFMEESPVTVRKLDLREQKKTVNHCMYPDFNSSGDDVYFTVRIEKENKKEKFNKYNNIAVVQNVFQYEADGFKGVKYEVLFDRKFDQIRPVCSPADPDMIAFISFKKDYKENFGYADYAIVAHNRKSGATAIVDNLTGYREYPFQWSPSGKRIYYCAALSISKTPSSFKEKRMNIINLQVADVLHSGGKFRTRILQNESSPFIIGDVATKDRGIAFVNDDLLLMAKYDPYESIFLVDINKWQKNDGFYIKQLPIPDDNDYPVVGKTSFIFLKYQYFNMPDNTIRTVSTVNKILYEPKIDEEALKAKKERREKKKKDKK